MKKIMHILLLLSFIINNTVAQTYTPFPENVAVWDVYYQPSEPGPVEDHTYYTMKGDTVINNITYNKIYSFEYRLSYPGGTKTVEITKKKEFNFGIRQDIPNKKVYRTIIVNNKITDTLLYDYNLKVGDTVPETYTTGNLNSDQTVVSIDFITFRAKQYRRFKLKSIGTNDAALIEGIGNANGLTEPHYGFFEAANILRDFCDADISDCSVPLVLKIEKVDAELSVNIYPNPFSDETTLNFTTEEPKRKAVLYSIIGEEIQTYDCSNKQLVIQKERLENGVYALKIINNNCIITKRLIVQ